MIVVCCDGSWVVGGIEGDSWVVDWVVMVGLCLQ